MTHEKGSFVISLDFELFWGVHDVFTKEAYGDNIRGAHDAVEEMVKLFSEYSIHATWAVVGMLYFKDNEHLKQSIPTTLPTYDNQKISAYHYMEHQPLEENELFFAQKLVQRIYQSKYQEIATHTFSHYYTLEKGQTLKQFSIDLDAAIKIANRHSHKIDSIVFPRNQVNESYLQTCFKKGITSYRGNEKGFVYQMKTNEKNKYIKRAIRFLDRYINLVGHQTYKLPIQQDYYPLNIRGSKFLVPYSKKLAWLDNRRLKRILNSMTYAAKKGEVYHLWWHPHNFGVNLTKNIAFLRDVLEHFVYLRATYGFESKNMKEIVVEATISDDQNNQTAIK